MGMSPGKKRRLHPVAAAVLAAVAAAAAIIFVVAAASDGTGNEREAVLAIGGESVFMDEFMLWANDSVAEVYGYFHERYGAEDNADFWTTAYGGEIPIERLKEQTLEKLKRIKAEQTMMKRLGVLEGTDYESFLRRFKAENHRRAKALEKGEPVFGPKQLTLNMFFQHEHEGNRIALLRLLEREWSLTDDALQQKYEQLRLLPEYRAADEIDAVRVAFPPGYSPMPEAVMHELGQGASPEQLVSLHPDAVAEKLHYGKDNRAAKEGGDPFYEAALEQRSGEWSGIIEGGEGRYSLMFVESRKVGEPKSFEEMKETVKAVVLNERYQAAVAEEAGRLAVIVHEEAYRRISVRDL
ncbi:peptidylprolyl isomerase [Paenibacillus sp. LHD-117]|uniref:peptidylprolyl isomerase n=1 Tax=Paenibacillus sp. LHD-117 TaxID=3071412 RepID=UPI0027DFD5D5|nr:peptidylprolyl isomerase [Paenibacillus sp. LHD-117]MDQ6422669.1 peptidylprolyl isomerase [Paenibacillus sp. LHD-117]